MDVDCEGGKEMNVDTMGGKPESIVDYHSELDGRSASSPTLHFSEMFSMLRPTF